MRSCAWRGRWRRRSLEANQQLAALVERQREENARLREELAVRDGELERVNAELAVLKRMLFGRSSERARPGTGGDDGEAQARPGGGGKTGTRGPGARAGRREYSYLVSARNHGHRPIDAIRDALTANPWMPPQAT